MRKSGLLTTIWTALLFYPLSSFALGLGEIEVSSFLNQPLKAEIEVISTRVGEVDDLLVSLASRDAFQKAGLERPGDLSKLRFKVEKSEDGLSAKILISTKKPIKEPFLNFLVEADWAKGRLLREFTVLLDPPYFAQQAEEVSPQQITEEPPEVSQPEPMASAPSSEAMAPVADTHQVEEEPVSQPIALSDESQVSDEDSLPYIADDSYLEGDTGTGDIVVNKGDTLWGIASQFKDDEHSMGQIMLAMQLMNPDAFNQDNINNLRVGAVLRVPDRDALDRLSKQEAFTQVLEQNGLWDEYVARKTGSPMAGSPVAVEGDDFSGEEADGQLSLLAPGDGDSTSASLQNDADSQDAGQIRKQLALAEEELEAARLENDDLQSRVSDLEQQLGKFEELQKLVQIEDDSLAQLQANESESPGSEMVAEATKDGMTGVVEDQPSDVMIEAADAIMAEQADDQMEDEVATESEQEMAQDLAEEMQSTEAETVIETVPQITEMSDEMSEDMSVMEEPVIEQQGAPVPAPVIVTETSVGTLDGGILDMLPSLDNLLSDPIMLGGIGAILALLIGLVFLKRKKSGEEDTGITLEEPTEVVDEEDATPIHVPTAEDVKQASDTDDPDTLTGDTAVMDTEQHMADSVSATDDEDEFSKTAIISADEIPSAEPSAQEEQDDVLNEVDVYLAYGLYDNAEELLKESLVTYPDRSDYRAKLLDTYFATKNADGFVKEAKALKSLGGAADRYWDRVQIMGFELAPDNELFAGARDSGLSASDLEYAKPEAADFDIGAEEDVTDFSNTDFDLSADTDTFDLAATELISEVGDDFPDTATFASVADGLSETQSLDDEIELVDLDSEDETLFREDDEESEVSDLPDEIGGFDLGEISDEIKDDVAEENIDEDALSFDLPDDLDLSAQTDDSLIALDQTVEVPDKNKVPPMNDGEIELDIGASEDVSETMVLDSGTVPEGEQVDDQGTQHIESALDMDMSDLESAELHTGTFTPVQDDEIIGDDITEFKPAEVTAEFAALDIESEAIESDLAVEEIDVNAGQDKTGTFAPGDFIDQELDEVVALAIDSDEIEDLMLPDDVDEVGTKLDLAKAFIDMGDAEGAKSSLEEVLSEGTKEQQAEATGLLETI